MCALEHCQFYRMAKGTPAPSGLIWVGHSRPNSSLSHAEVVKSSVIVALCLAMMLYFPVLNTELSCLAHPQGALSLDGRLHTQGLVMIMFFGADPV